MLVLNASQKDLPSTSGADALVDTSDPSDEQAKIPPGVSSSDADALPTNDSSQDSSPPPYLDSAPFCPASTPVNFARSNYLECMETDRAIKGTWTIDSSLAIPSSVLEQQQWDESEGPRPNLNLDCKNQGIKGQIVLCGPADDVVYLRVNSEYGALDLKVDNQTKQRTQMNFVTRYRGVTVYLPPDFTGHIECETKYGAVTFSNQVAQNVTRFSNHHGKHLAFLSPSPVPSGGLKGSTVFDDAPDKLCAKTENGSIKVYYMGEVREPGWFGRMFSK